MIGVDRHTLRHDQGFFLPETWRVYPSVCAFTSELYYDVNAPTYHAVRHAFFEAQQRCVIELRARDVLDLLAASPQEGAN